MADKVFSAARLRGYRVIEAAGLSTAVDLQVLNTLLAARLWLPFSLIEVAFRNAVDEAVASAHDNGADWLLASGREGDVLRAASVTGPSCFHGTRDDGTADDPVAMAARMAARQLGREQISRDDLVAHLMLGFWVVRAPEGLARDARLGVFDLLAGKLRPPYDDGEKLGSVMVNHVLRTRNRVAHHEPLLFRAKHVFVRTGDPKDGNDLITSLLGAIEKFVEEAELSIATARTFAPMAEAYLETALEDVKRDIAPLEKKLEGELGRRRAIRDKRRAARREQPS